MCDDFTDDARLDFEQDRYDKDLPKGKQAAHNSEVRKRIDDLLAQKRLKALLDDIDNWDL
jgi:hypothetical protein